MSDDIDRIWRIREERDKAKLLLDAYEDVSNDLHPDLLSGLWDLLDGRRLALSEKIHQANASIRTIRDACQHAWERVGEARPPFEHCVRCAATQPAGTAHRTPKPDAESGGG